jgi:hypothetical protein
MLDAETVAKLTSGTAAGWTAVLLMAGWIIRTWPAWKQRVNEARKIELDSDAVLRTDLLARIHALEEGQTKDRREFNEAMAEERRRCDGELEEIRTRLRQAENDNRGLMAMIRQVSSSTAMVVTNPDGTALTTAARKKRGQEQK